MINLFFKKDNYLTFPVPIPDVEVLKGLHKTFRGTAKKCEDKNFTFLFSKFFITIQILEMYGSLRVKYVSLLLSSIWSVLLEYLHHFHVVIFYGVFSRCLFLFAFVCGFAAVLLLLLFFSLSFSFLGQNFSFNSKDIAVKAAAVELNIRTIIVLLLLTLKILYNSLKLLAQQVFIEQFLIQH